MNNYLFGPADTTDTLSAKLDVLGIAHGRVHFSFYCDVDVHLSYQGRTICGKDGVERFIAGKNVGERRHGYDPQPLGELPGRHGYEPRSLGELRRPPNVEYVPRGYEPRPLVSLRPSASRKRRS